MIIAVQALIFVTLLPSLGAAFRGNKDVERIRTKLECVTITTLSSPRAESARAFTGRRNSYSGRGELAFWAKYRHFWPI